MSILSEALDEPVSTPIHDALSAGLDVLSGEQTVEFVPYVRMVLPVDGFVFWVKASLLPSEKLADYGLTSGDSVEIKGSLHYEHIGGMDPDENITIVRVNFATPELVTDLVQIGPQTMLLGEWDTPFGQFKFSFGHRSTYYQQADIHHHVGDAVYPPFYPQLIDDISQFEQRPVVSNSLPIWLSLRDAIPFASPITFNTPLFPAYLSIPNMVPPYGTVLINASSTRAFSAMALRDRRSSRAQLVTENVQVTFYGLRNDEVMDFVDYVIDRSMLGDYGIMNMPVVRDVYRTQLEIAALAQKKLVEFDICYEQTRTRDIARQLIRSAIVGIYEVESPVPTHIAPINIPGSDANPL